jgi:branched-subunit amino acid transport protein
VSQETILLVIAGMAVANFAIRFAPIAVLSRLDLPGPLLRWLSFVPVSVMGALVTSEVLRPGGQWRSPLSSPGVYAALLTAIVFYKTKSFLGATVTGMVAFVALRALIG